MGVPAADGDPRFAPLSERERDIVHLVALSYTNQEIGKKPSVSVPTVDMYGAYIVRSSSSKRLLSS